MNIILFAILGALINAPKWYWIVYGVMTFFRVSLLTLKTIIKIVKVGKEE